MSCRYGIAHFYDLVPVQAAQVLVQQLREDLLARKLQARMKVAQEGVNGWITGPLGDVESYCEHLRADFPKVFEKTDFKISPCSEGELSRGVKVWESTSVCKLLDRAEEYEALSNCTRAPHLTPEEWHQKLCDGKDLVLFDVRNLYETRIGRFCEDAPGVVDSVDPQTLSYEQVPGFLSKESNLSRFKGKTVMMYCTGGVRCERASSLLCSHLGETAEVFQLEGGIHRYLEKFPSGGFFQGAMYVFDRRRAVRGYDLLGEAQHERQILGTCCLCGSSWEMYQGKWKCGECKMPILICLQCQGRCSHAGTRHELRCELCKPPQDPAR
ncbi:unnamed protein product [Durusdinium trenchii]|uniref:Uncharacterized protein n=2 Tax=Durusdinium trenchii TaxID=1381693 RepID=A0ABP0SJD2_9DINO